MTTRPAFNTQHACDTRHALNTEGQTPLFLAELLWERHYAGRVAPGTVVLEPTCGRGAFLRAIPPGLPAFGIERDANLAAEARRRSGRPVITGEIETAEIPQVPGLILGNLPFRLPVLLALLRRAQGWLPDGGGGEAGLILSAEMLSTPATIEQLAPHWTIRQELLPRTLFHKVRTPILFVQFRRERQRQLHGFALFAEGLAFRDLPREVKALLTDNDQTGRMPTWRSLARQALRQLGGRGTLPQIYAAVEGPAAASGKLQGNRFWQPKLRQVLQLGPEFEPAGRGAWALAEDREAA